MKKWMQYLMIGISGLGLTACGTQPAADESLPSEINDSTTNPVETVAEPITVDFWHAMSGSTETALNHLVTTFNEGIGLKKILRLMLFTRDRMMI